jgi:hypothetical protein
MGESELFLISLQEDRREPRATFRPRPLRCPDCRSTAVSRVQRQNFIEYLVSVVRIAPFRCEPCLRRFWAISLHRRPSRVSPPSSPHACREGHEQYGQGERKEIFSPY